MVVHPDLDLIIVSDVWNHRIQSFHGDGTIVNQWGSQGGADGQFNYPKGVAVLARSHDREHSMRQHIYVADTYNHRIQVFNFDGSFVHKWGSRGESEGQFCYPCHIGVNLTQNLIYVADSYNCRVQVFGPDGTFIRKWSIQLSDNNQWGMAVHPTRDLVFISEAQGHYMRVYGTSGTVLFDWQSQGSRGERLDTPERLALHPTRDLLFVTDFDNHQVKVFDLKGYFICKWGSNGNADGQFCSPSGIAIHPTKDVIYVGESNRIQAFSLFQKIQKCKKKSKC